MSEIKHTPGPWGISSQSPTIIKQFDCLGEAAVIIGSASGWTGASCFPSDEEGVANARLISAAPDLLEALQVVLKIIERHVGTSTAAIEGTPIFMARAAIAKATGSQK